MSNRKADVYFKERKAGVLAETEKGYEYVYLSEYLSQDNAQPLSLTMPLKNETFFSSVLFPFFDGLIPEGWLLDIAEENWKLNEKDRMGLLLNCCEDCIGAVSVKKMM